MHGFYNPDLSEAEVEALDWANWLVLQAVQALLGSISDNFLGVAVEPLQGAVKIHVALREVSERDDEAVEDALFDLDVLLGGRVVIERAIVVGIPDVGRWQSSGLRFVFLRNPV